MTTEADRTNDAAIAAAERGDVEEALRLFLRAVDQGSREAQSNLGRYMRELGRPEDACEAYRTAALAGDNEAWIFLGNVLSDDLGRTREAAAAYQRATELGCPAGYLNLGVMAESDSRFAEAERLYRLAIQHGDDLANWQLAELLTGLHRTHEAEAHYRLAIDAGEVRAFEGLAFMLRDTGRIHEAEEVLKAGIAAGDGWLVNALGVLLDQQGRRREAIDLYEAALAAGNKEVIVNLANVHSFDEATWERAESLYLQAIASGDLTAWRNYGDLLDEQGRTREAIAAYDAAVKVGDLEAEERRLAVCARVDPDERL